VSHEESVTGVNNWSALLATERRATALDVARDVAVRVTDRERVAVAVVSAREQTHFPQSVHWEAGGIAQGDAGLALLCAYLDRCFPDEGWDVSGHGFLASAAADAERGVLGPSLYGGIAGLGFVAWQLGRDGTRYTRMSRTLDGALAPQSVELAVAVECHDHGVSVGQFDVISGLSGIGAYLLTRRGEPHIDAALEKLLETLVDLTRASPSGLPRWFTPVELMFDETTAALYPNGHLNCGLAHGIPGPLALMALAHAEGLEVRGLRDAIASIAAWLCDHRSDDAWGINWPTMVAPPSTPSVRAPPSRAAWCYGSPGVARALWLAGTAVEDEQLMTLASEAMQAVYRRPLHERQIDSPTFCHGVAGLLQITLRFAHDTGAAFFAAAAADLADQLLAAYDPNTLLGFCSIEPGGNAVDQPGLLDGAAGVALVLLGAATDVEPTWDRLFLLA
jgi:hypothetical protein